MNSRDRQRIRIIIPSDKKKHPPERGSKGCFVTNLIDNLLSENIIRAQEIGFVVLDDVV